MPVTRRDPEGVGHICEKKGRSLFRLDTQHWSEDVGFSIPSYSHFL